jgi:hypothetical protein
MNTFNPTISKIHNIILSFIVLITVILLSESSLLLSNLFFRSIFYLLISFFLFSKLQPLDVKGIFIVNIFLFFHFLITTISVFGEENLGIDSINRNVGFYLLFMSSASISFILIRVYGFKILEIYSNIIYHLAIISLLFFFVQLIDAEFVYNIVNQIQEAFNIPINKIYTSQSIRISYSTALIYTINVSENTFFFENRNSGFCFEPTSYASFLSLAMIINLIITNFKLNYKFYVLFIALITTFSTSGFICILLILITYLVNSKNYSKAYLFLLILLLISVLSLDFIFVKIQQTGLEFSDVNQRIADLERFSDSNSDVIALGRGASFQYMISNEFIKYPIFGYGGFDTGRDSNLSLVSGIGEILIRFGLFGFIIYFLLLFKGSRAVMQNTLKFRIIILLIIIINLISYNFLFNIFYLVFLFIPRDLHLKSDHKLNFISR